MSKQLSPKQQEDKEHPLPIYPAGQDIYSKSKKEDDIDPETKEPVIVSETGSEEWNEKDLADDETMGDDLDVPGAELDDANEKIGEEDEENNFYSLGGDNHNDLEEENSDDI